MIPTKISSFFIRQAEPDDVPLILAFVRELAEYEKLSHEVVATEALAVVADEKLAQNARTLGARFREAMQELVDESPLLKSVRGRGLLNAVLINDTPDSSTAWDLCVALKDNGLLAKPTHGNIIRFAPPLVMTAEQLEACIDIIANTVRAFKPNA